MIFYLLGLLSYYKLAGKPVPPGICLLFFGVVVVPPATTLYFLLNKHWIFEVIAFAGGLFCWTFIEYFIHRFLMHAKERKGHTHGDHFHHHSTGIIFTTHVKRILFIAAAVSSLWTGIFISAYILLPAGILTGFAIYSYMHVWLHKQWATRWLGGLQKFHIQHHIGQTEKCFGVTTMLWDHLFNTAAIKTLIAGEKARNVYFARITPKSHHH